MPKVSVVIASYNHEPYVRLAIESVLEQSFQDFEIVVTDDGSVDRTAAEVRAIGDKRVSLVVLSRNSGACVALNASITRAQGQYIAVLNSDDLFLPGKLEKQVAYLDGNRDVGAVFTYPSFVNAVGDTLADSETNYQGVFRVENHSREEWLRHFFFYGNALCHPSILIRKRCYDVVGFYNPALAQLPDLEMWVRLLGRFSIHVLTEPLLGFRILDNNMNASAPRPEVIVRDLWEWQKVLEQYLILDSEIIAGVFPEIADYPNKSWLPKWLIMLAERMLVRYLPHLEIGPNTGARTYRQRTELPPVSWRIAELALQVGKPAHIMFALDSMYQALPKMRHDLRYREFIEKTGSCDPFGALFGLPLNRDIRRIRAAYSSPIKEV
jgi:glycosyltransferase involved in cell wall biosynthesis